MSVKAKPVTVRQLADRLAKLERRLGALPTIDIPGVPILAAGGPYFGTGSPPEGDYFTKADLELIAEQTNKLQSAGELRPPSKLGHSDEQRLLQNSGLPVGDELPAAGWLTNFTVAEVGGIWKLLCDVKEVPAKLGQIFQSGGYRTRSVELSKVVSQVDQVSYDGVVTGLAWLGAKAPAVRTLDDIWNLYAVDDVVWEEEDGCMDLMADLTAAINAEVMPGEPSYMWELWVNDINLALNKCTASDWDGDTTWVIGFKVGADNEPILDPRESWTPSTMKLVEIDAADADPLGSSGAAAMDDEEYSASSRYALMRREARAKFSERAADTKGMKLTDKQVAELAKTFGIDGDEADLRTKVEAHLQTVVEPAAAAQPEPTPAPTATALSEKLAGITVEGMEPAQVKAFADQVSEVLAPFVERANRGDRAYAQQFARVRDDMIFEAIETGRLNPADREDWVAFYDANAELAAKQLKALPVNPILLLTYGLDNDGTSAQTKQVSAADEAYLAATGARDPSMATAGQGA